MSHRPVGLRTRALAILMALVLAPAATATPVSVRVVGDAVGVETTVDVPRVEGPTTCQDNSAARALDIAVAGNWDHQPFTSTILGETHAYTVSDYWNLWVNGAYSLVGLCDYPVNAGDRILMLVQRDSAAFAPTVFPLQLSGVPPSVGAGVPFTVTVTEQRAVPDASTTTTVPTPIAGATVSGGGASAQTDATGRAAITLPAAGNVALRATRPGNVASDAVTLTVVAAAVAGALAAPAPPPVFTRDLTAPAANIRAIAEGRRFGRGFGPRVLRVRVDPDPSGLLTVKLRLTRIDRSRCSYFSGKSERFVVTGRGDCSASDGFWFAVGDREETTYLLPRRLPRGRYVLDANAIDKAYNRDDRRRRGGNRVVFHVG